MSFFLKKPVNCKFINMPYLACFPRDHIGKEIIRHGFYEHKCLELLFGKALAKHKDTLKNKTALDVGANIGNHSCYFAPLFKNVISFEPNPLPRHLLEANKIANGFEHIHIEPVGLGEKDEELEFFPFGNKNIGKGSFDAEQVKQEENFKEPVTLPIVRGDDLLKEKYPDANIGFIKLDIEGFEYFALKGLENTIKKHKPFIVFESNKTQGDHAGYAIKSYLESFGYQNFYAITRTQIKPRIAEKIKKSIFGKTFRLKEINTLEEKEYPMVLATCDPLTCA